MENFLFEGEGVMNMKAITNVRVLETTRDKVFKDWGELKTSLLKEMVTRIVTKRLSFQLKLDKILRMKSMEKVEELYKVFPAILDYFYEKDIASLLDIRRENFSRMKRKVMASKKISDK